MRSRTSLAVDAFTHAGPADPARFDPATCMQASIPGAGYETGLQPIIGEAASGGPEWRLVNEETPLMPYTR